MPEPIQVYPPPDGPGTSSNYVPSDTRLAMGSIAAGAGAVITAAAGSGTVPGDALLFFFQSAANSPGGFWGIHAASSGYVFLFLVLASLSVILATVNLVIGLRMRDRLRELSRKANDLCKQNGLFDWYKKSKAPA